MKKTLTGILTALIVVALAIYTIERYLLKGDLIADASMRPSDINPAPTLPLQVPEGDSTVTAYLRSEMDADYTLRVLNPAEEVLLEETVTSTRYSFKIDTPVAGTYRVQVTLDDPPGRAVHVRAFMNDKRIVYPIYARFF